MSTDKPVSQLVLYLLRCVAHIFICICFVYEDILLGNSCLSLVHQCSVVAIPSVFVRHVGIIWLIFTTAISCSLQHTPFLHRQFVFIGLIYLLWSKSFESWIIMFKASFLIIVMFDGTWSKQWLQSFIILLCTEKIAVFHFLEGYLFLGWQAPTYVTTYSHLRLLRCAHLTW